MKPLIIKVRDKKTGDIGRIMEIDTGSAKVEWQTLSRNPAQQWVSWSDLERVKKGKV